jgi:hypothetical protein
MPQTPDARAPGTRHQLPHRRVTEAREVLARGRDDSGHRGVHGAGNLALKPSH